MSSSAIFILDLKGKVIVGRNYRGDVDLNVIDKFMPLYMEKEEEGSLTPVLYHHEATFVYVKHSNLYCKYDHRFPGLLFLGAGRSSHVHGRSKNLNYRLLSVITVCKRNSNVMLVLSVLFRMVEVGRQ